MADFASCDQLGDLGATVVRLALERVYRVVKETPKEINAQLKNADLMTFGLKALCIPDLRYEVKTERLHTGNLFFETWSNRKQGRRGWAVTTTCDVLYYLFWEDAKGYRIDDMQRKKWVLDYSKRDFPEVLQKRTEQTNDTWGLLVPVDCQWLGAQEFTFKPTKKYVERNFSVIAA